MIAIIATPSGAIVLIIYWIALIAGRIILINTIIEVLGRVSYVYIYRALLTAWSNVLNLLFVSDTIYDRSLRLGTKHILSDLIPDLLSTNGSLLLSLVCS